MPKYFLSIFFFCFLVLSSCKSSKIENDDIPPSPYTFNFVRTESVVALSDKAIKENKLIFLDVYTDWCLPCKMMDEDVFKDKKLGDYYNENFISFKANAEAAVGSDFAALYQVKGYPTLLFLDSSGRLLVEKTGIVRKREMYELADEALAIHQEMEMD